MMADTVGMTLGPMGRNVAYEQRSWEPPRVSKDGVTVAKEVELADPFEDLGASLLYHIASNTNDSAGDGTTTATVLAREFFKGIQTQTDNTEFVYKSHHKRWNESNRSRIQSNGYPTRNEHSHQTKHLIFRNDPRTVLGQGPHTQSSDNFCEWGRGNR